MVDEDGGQLGVMPPFEAIKLAREKGLDLVEISPTADPPVCKITDYGKYLYQTNKKAHEQRKHQKGSVLKEVKFRPATAEHDYQVRKNQIIRFLGEGHKVKAMIFHRGREMAHQEVGRAKMHRLLGEIADHALVEIGPRMEANVLMALLAPKRGGAAPVKPASARGGRPEPGVGRASACRVFRRAQPKSRQAEACPTWKKFREETFVAKKVKKLKLKTHRGAAKRFKITATGKVMRMHSGKRHLLGTKKANRMRRLKKMKQVSPADAGNVHKMLPYG